MITFTVGVCVLGVGVVACVTAFSSASMASQRANVVTSVLMTHAGIACLAAAFLLLSGAR